MSRSILSRMTALSAVLLLAACSDATSPERSLSPTAPALSGSGIDTTQVAGGGGGGGGGGGTGGGGTGGGGSTVTACGTLSTQIIAYNIVVYTTRTGIGLSGTAVNCGTRKVSFEIDATDQNPDPSCKVDMPHFIAAKNTDPGMSLTWQVNSTLVPCQNQLHTFDLRLWDTRTGQTLATTTASAFL